ncbi:MAG: hypothetical protein ACKVP0_04115, partial [Pirellulaceae bacterium]
MKARSLFDQEVIADVQEHNSRLDRGERGAVPAAPGEAAVALNGQHDGEAVPLDPPRLDQHPQNGQPGNGFVQRLQRGNGVRHVQRPAASFRVRQRGFFDQPPEIEDPPPPVDFTPPASPQYATSEKAKAVQILAAVRTLKTIEREQRAAHPLERQILSEFPGFGCVALSIFPDPVTKCYKPGWEGIGRELQELLTGEEYESAKRSTYNAFYTSPAVISAMHSALERLGVPDQGIVLEPGMGTGRFCAGAPPGYRFIGVELDSLSARIASALFPQHDIRNQDFRLTKLPQVDAVIGNPPFADVKTDYDGQKLSLHDFFLAKSLDALKPNGVLACVTSHFTLDRMNSSARDLFGEKGDFLGAIRLPSSAFKNEGTAVVTDIVFFRKRSPSQVCSHVDPQWEQTAPLCIDVGEITINRYFHNHPEMVLGTYSRKDTLYGEGYSVLPNGDLAKQLKGAIERLPRARQSDDTSIACPENEPKTQALARAVAPEPDKPLAEGSFFVRNACLFQIEDGQGVPVVYRGKEQRSDSGTDGRRIAAEIDLRDKTRRVLQSQNEGWPEQAREDARRQLRWAHDRFLAAFGPISKTTFSETKDGSVIRRMPNLTLFKQDP